MSSTSLNNIATIITQPVVLIPITVLVAAASFAITFQRLSPPITEPAQAFKTIGGAEVEINLDSHDIIAMNLFGAPKADTKVEQNDQDIPETNLKLSLKGAFANSDPEKSSALIAPDINSKAELFLIDESLPGGAKLDKVYPNYVVIRRNGKLEKLQFLRSQPGTQDQNNGSYSTYEPPEQFDQPPQQYQHNAPQSAPTNSVNSSTNPGSVAEIRERLRQRDKK